MTLSHTSAEAFPASEYLRDELEERGWTVTEFADMIGQPAHAVSEILKDKRPITPETGQSLSEALGTSPDLWLKLKPRTVGAWRMRGRMRQTTLRSSMLAPNLPLRAGASPRPSSMTL